MVWALRRRRRPHLRRLLSLPDQPLPVVRLLRPAVRHAPLRQLLRLRQRFGGGGQGDDPRVLRVRLPCAATPQRLPRTQLTAATLFHESIRPIHASYACRIRVAVDCCKSRYSGCQFCCCHCTFVGCPCCLKDSCCCEGPGGKSRHGQPHATSPTQERGIATVPLLYLRMVSARRGGAADDGRRPASAQCRGRATDAHHGALSEARAGGLGEGWGGRRVGGKGRRSGEREGGNGRGKLSSVSLVFRLRASRRQQSGSLCTRYSLLQTGLNFRNRLSVTPSNYFWSARQP